MTRSWLQLQQQAAEAGFAADGFEKVLHLLDLLHGLSVHPYLRSRLALKGGTALNVFVLDLPRLSVDLDLNYVGTADRETMLAERPIVEAAIEAVCSRLGLTVRRVPGEHAGGKWRLRYLRAAGGTGTLELDLNYVLRVPLWPVQHLAPRAVLGARPAAVPVLDLHELAAGKLAALFGRTAARDVYDAHALFQGVPLDTTRLRLGFVIYGAMNRKDWRSVGVEQVALDVTEAERMLVPLLHGGEAPARGSLASWVAGLTQRTREGLARVLPFEPHELAFLDALLDHGELRPELLTEDPAMAACIELHPGLAWKAMNVRAYRG